MDKGGIGLNLHSGSFPDHLGGLSKTSVILIVSGFLIRIFAGKFVDTAQPPEIGKGEYYIEELQDSLLYMRKSRILTNSTPSSATRAHARRMWYIGALKSKNSWPDTKPMESECIRTRWG